MEKTRQRKMKANSKGNAKQTVAGIEQAYREYVLTKGSGPSSVFTFCKHVDMPEAKFYELFGSLEGVEKSIWKKYVDAVVKQQASDSSYAAFSAREKILSFYFSLVEVLKNDRSFVLVQLKGWKNPGLQPSFMKPFHAAFDAWAMGVIEEGKKSGEIARRPFVDERYHHLLWLHCMFILQFWIQDDSANFDKTDEAIEKSVHLGFDLIGKGILDNALEFGKFLYQNSRN